MSRLSTLFAATGDGSTGFFVCGKTGKGFGALLQMIIGHLERVGPSRCVLAPQLRVNEVVIFTAMPPDGRKSKSSGY